MRLRYLHLAHYPPLTDLALDFSSRAPWAAFDSRGAASPCAIHFVIGLNGGGKSHLLRALAGTFLALADERMPGFPVSLMYELGTPGQSDHRTVVFDCPGEKHTTSLWLADGWRFADSTERSTFQTAIEYLRRVDGGRAEFGGALFEARIARGDYPQAASYALPRAVLAYTSGLLDPWRELWLAPVDSKAPEIVTQGDDYDPSTERPAGWTTEDESRIPKVEGSLASSLSATSSLESTLEEDSFRRPRLLEQVELTAAVLAVALQKADLQRPGSTDSSLASLFAKVDLRRLIGVRIKLNLERALSAPRALLVRLHDALLAAGEVIAEPHPSEARRSMYFELTGPLPTDSSAFKDASRFEKLHTQGEALEALLGEPDDTAFERFGQLLAWRQHGLLDELDIFVRRTDLPNDDDEETLQDSGVLRFSELSDGERLVLGRWALFHLLEGQEDALLLLDEPETHFNDAWKREIVSVVEDAMGRNASQVVISTHSAIVLSDVFDDEVVLIRKVEGHARAAAVTDRTFATDPSALMMTVFEADDSIGLRAQRRIEAFMQAAVDKVHPTTDDVRQLKALVRQLGTGLYRTELLTLLHRWQQAPQLHGIEDALPPAPADTLKDELRALLQEVERADKHTDEEGDA